MTIYTLVLYIGIAAIVSTLLIGFVLKKEKSWVMTFLQSFTGLLFIFSGWVKAIDPLGTAYKMEQYFTEFESTFADTWMSFLAPIFPFFSHYSIWFSVAMIVFEIVLGVMLLIGYKPKLSAWLFLGLVVFFTVLTGFTYLTGYVPEGVNFFDFGQWGPYKATNMKVTDCGCFGDFIKLEPRTSFFKDLFLLLPAIYFVFKHSDMHQLFSGRVRFVITSLATIGLLLYCFSNFVWDLPSTDFRPFKVGADVAAIKEAEEEAEANVRILTWIIKNEKTGEVKELPDAEYMKSLNTYNSKNGWKVIDQTKSEPAVKHTKISEFEITDFEGNDVTYEYLDDEGYHFMVVCYKAYGHKNPDGSYQWDKDWIGDLVSKIKPLAEKAKKDGHMVSIVLGGLDGDGAKNLAQTTGIDAHFYSADDILLKTIIRSNPGPVLWHDGKIVGKWHIKKLPTYEEIMGK